MLAALTGGIYASNPDSFSLSGRLKIDLPMFSIHLLSIQNGPVQGVRLESFVEQAVKIKRIEDTKIPFYPIATDLNTGETIILEKGSIAKAVRASSSARAFSFP